MAEMNFDEILEMVGNFGRTQIMLLILFCIINVLSAFHYFGQTIISVIPEYTCDDQVNGTDVLEFRKCSILVSNGSEPFVKNCEQWCYNTKNIYGFRGIVQDLNWVCDNSFKPALGQSLFFIGSVLGTLILGYLADKFGRVMALVVANTLVIFGTYITLASTNLYIFSLGRFFAGAATDTNFVMMYIIVLEYLRPSLRTFGLNVCIGVFYSLACMIVPWLAVLLKNWKMFLLLVATPHFLIISYWFIVPESAQWLISKGKIKEAIASFEKIATMNRKLMKEDVINAIKSIESSETSDSQRQENFLGLLRTPNLRRKTIILIFKSMVMTLCYDTISRNVNGLDASPFWVFTLGSSTILPACLLISFVQDKIGRKALASGSLFISAVCMSVSGLTQILVKKPTSSLIIPLAVVARFAINVAYNSGAQYAVELIPTVVRGQGVSFIHVAGYAASFFSPHILYLAGYWRPTPEIILGILLIMGSIACLFLPETLHKTLPISLNDGENFGEDEEIFEFACCRKNITNSTTALNPGLYETCYL